MVNFLFRVFEIINFCCVVALFDQVHDVDAIHCICLLLTASGNLFLKMSDAHETANVASLRFKLQFHRHYSDFRKKIQMLLAAKEDET